jgi:hypothetical protein
VRLTHNHVTISVSILRPIILLLLNYIARYSAEKKTFCTKKTYSDIFSYSCDNLHLSALYSTLFSYSTLFDNVYRVCVLVRWLRQIFARCVNEKSVAAALTDCCVFVSSFYFFFANSQNVAIFSINFYSSVCARLVCR